MLARRLIDTGWIDAGRRPVEEVSGKGCLESVIREIRFAEDEPHAVRATAGGSVTLFEEEAVGETVTGWRFHLDDDEDPRAGRRR